MNDTLAHDIDDKSIGDTAFEALRQEVQAMKALPKPRLRSAWSPISTNNTGAIRLYTPDTPAFYRTHGRHRNTSL